MGALKRMGALIADTKKNIWQKNRYKIDEIWFAKKNNRKVIFGRPAFWLRFSPA